MFIGIKALPGVLALLRLLSGSPSAGSAQEKEIHEEIVVTAARTPSVFSEAARSVIVIDRSEIEAAPVRSIPELLEYALGVDVRQRGPFGVQADLSLRGGTFEQTLVLIDGVKIGDPQTGHHSVILPLTLDDVERVEILKGSGSRLFGPNAFGGAVNIITRKGRETRSRVGASFGQNGLVGGDASLAVPLGASGHGLSFSRKRSDGYRENTDFDITSLSYRASLPAAGGEISVGGGHTDMAFGANGFYSDRFPMQWERTRTTFLQASGEFRKNGRTVIPKAYTRRNADEFILDRNDPEWFRNTHTTHTGGLELQVSFDSKLGRTAIGGEFGRDGITSETLGNRSRTKGGVFLEHRWIPRSDFILTAGAFVYRFSEWGWRAWPGMEAVFSPVEGFRIFGSWNRSFRVPTYTERFYADPANRGYPGLKPEKAGEFELGLRLKRTGLDGNLSVFRRNGRDLIDWVRMKKDDPWEARNIADLNTRGFEVQLRLFPPEYLEKTPLSRVQAGYARLDTSGKDGPYESKYALDHLKHQFILALELQAACGIRQSWKVRFEERRGYPGHVLVDGRLSWRGNGFEIHIGASNLLNAEYTDFGNIPMPRRWIVGGLTVDLARRSSTSKPDPPARTAQTPRSRVSKSLSGKSLSRPAADG